MTYQKKVFLAVMFAGAAALPTMAMAQARGGTSDLGFYIGASVGQSKTDCDTGGTGLSCDDKDTAWRVFGGYKFHPNIAVEGGYTDLGKATASGLGVDAKAEATAWDLVAVGIWPLGNNFSIFGKLGFYNGEIKVSSNVAGGEGKKTTTDVTYGIGVQYDFMRNLGVRGEWQRYASAKGPETTITNEDKNDIDVLSIGVIWKF